MRNGSKAAILVGLLLLAGLLLFVLSFNAAQQPKEIEATDQEEEQQLVPASPSSPSPTLKHKRETVKPSQIPASTPSPAPSTDAGESSEPASTPSPKPNKEAPQEPTFSERLCPQEWRRVSRSVCLGAFRAFSSDIFVTRIDLGDPAVEVKPGFVSGEKGRLDFLSRAAERNGAQVAVNSSFLRGSNPVGPIAYNGRWVSRNSFPQRVFLVMKGNRTEVLMTEEALSRNAESLHFAVSGSHWIVTHGKAVQEYGEDNAGQLLYGRHPRTSIGITSDNFLLLTVVDGRSSASRGVTLPQLASIMGDLGAKNAVNLDGGGSSEMLVNGDLVNCPVGTAKHTCPRYGTERPLGVALFVFVENAPSS